MVAARSASQVADVAVASELGSLLYSYCSITHPRWRLEAVLRVHALTRRLAIVVPRLERELATLLARAACPDALRVPLVALARRTDGDACARIAEALFMRGWIAAAASGIAAALRLGDRDAACAIRDRVLAGSRLRASVLDDLVEWGYERQSRKEVPFLASLVQPGSEQAYRPSARLVTQLVNDICVTGDHARGAVARELVACLPRAEQMLARVQLCRLTLASSGRAAAECEARGIREKSHRTAARRLLAASAIARSADRATEVLNNFERYGYDIDALLPELRVHGVPADAVLALATARRVERLGRRLTPTTLPRVVTPNATALERALFDEGVALSPQVSQRRRVLIDAARATVRLALQQPTSVAPDVLDARLRTLVHLGGELATSAVANAVTQAPIGACTNRAIEAWCDLDAASAGAYVVEHADRLSAHCAIGHLLGGAELRGGLPLGFADAYRRAHARAKSHAYVWRFIQAWRAHRHMDPDARALRWLAQQEPIEPIELIRTLDDDIAGSHVDHLKAVLADLDRELLARPPRVWAQMKPWTEWKWRGHLETARDHVVVNPAIVERCAKWLRFRSDRLAVGDLGVPCGTFDVSGVTYRVRLLDKRRDVLTYLRFADVPVPSCYRSSARTWSWSDRDTIDAWGDPLTFCFHIERGVGTVFQPCGFLFGGFAEVAARRSIVLNSLHVRPNTLALRFAILEHVERHLCRALGIGLLGIANVHNGRGELPRTYEERVVELIRFRALRCRDVGDDICGEVNERTSSCAIYWRSLDR